MILVFGGTTEGRAAVEVLEGAGQLYYYSTYGDSQQIECRNGIRLTGKRDAEEITGFCREKGIQLLVDAAHPFAAQLHQNIAQAAIALDIPVIRYERTYPPRDPQLIWCDTFEEALIYLETHRVQRLLALTGVKTIPRLKSYWEKQDCWFRVWDRQHSLPLAEAYGFPAEQLLFFEDGEEEAALLKRLSPGAILTKESGESGYYKEKVKAAQTLEIPVLVVRRPALPEGFLCVRGKEGLKHQVERLLPHFFPLRGGFTTGSCTCAAAKAALVALCSGEKLSVCSITLPQGEEVTLPVEDINVEEGKATATVIKDAGDDPDVTHGCHIIVTVCLTGQPGIQFIAGEGVGRVTLPGLGLEIGAPAINATPRRMIGQELMAVLAKYGKETGVEVTVTVPGGAELAQKTFNPKLGIVGGISIIGTSGIVRPFSVDAFVQTIKKEMQVAVALGCRHIIINSGAKSEQVLKELFPDFPPQAFIHYGNFIGETLRIAAELEVERVTMGIMIGKAVKLAEGNFDTHSRKVVMNREFIISLAGEADCSAEECRQMAKLTLARELWELLPSGHPFFNLLIQKCSEVCSRVYPRNNLDIILIPENS